MLCYKGGPGDLPEKKFFFAQFPAISAIQNAFEMTLSENECSLNFDRKKNINGCPCSSLNISVNT